MPSGRSNAFCEYHVRVASGAMSCCADHGPASDYSPPPPRHVRDQKQIHRIQKYRRRTEAENHLFGFGAQPLVWDAIRKYSCGRVSGGNDDAGTRAVRTPLRFTIPGASSVAAAHRQPRPDRLRAPHAPVSSLVTAVTL